MSSKARDAPRTGAGRGGSHGSLRATVMGVPPHVIPATTGPSRTEGHRRLMFRAPLRGRARFGQLLVAAGAECNDADAWGAALDIEAGHGSHSGE